MLTAFANPTRFHAANRTMRPWLGTLTLILLGCGLYTGLYNSPPDYQQGESVRIMYVHVPAAWSAMGIYAGMAMASLVFLVWKHSLADRVARQSAPIAIAMSAITLITGSLWGKPTWGAYWVWDARLTSMLILLLIVTGYHMLARRSDFDENRQKSCALFCLFGTLNLPIIKFSVEWWHTLHQPASILRSGGVAIDSQMLLPLLLMAAGFFTLYLFILSLRMETALLQARIKRLRHNLRLQQERSTL